MMTVTMAEVASRISNNQHIANNAMSSTASNMQHKLSVTGPIIHCMQREIAQEIAQQMREKESESDESVKVNVPRNLFRSVDARISYVDKLCEFAKTLPMEERINGTKKSGSSGKRVEQIALTMPTAKLELEAN